MNKWFQDMKDDYLSEYEISPDDYSNYLYLPQHYLISGTNSGVSPNGKMFVTNGEMSKASFMVYLAILKNTVSLRIILSWF